LRGILSPASATAFISSGLTGFKKNASWYSCFAILLTASCRF